MNPASGAVRLDVGTIGIVADIHANPFALGAVLTHGAQAGVDRWVVLGDVVAMGPEPERVLRQLREVEVVAWVAGNTERYVLTGDRPDPTFEEVEEDPSQLQRLVEVTASFAWTKGFLAASGSLPMLREFRSSVEFKLPDGTLALAVHASLEADDGPGITPDEHPDVLADLFVDTNATIIFGGHTHRATDRAIDGVRFVNPGSVSNHHTPEATASYATLHLERSDHVVTHHDVDYDKQSAIDSIRTSGIPGSEFLLRRYFDEPSDGGAFRTNGA